MTIYVGVTDRDWFEYLKSQDCDEVNFWTPGARPFKALSENEMFLFKLHSPDNYIVGGGFFVRHSILPTYLAWQAFGIKNGTKSLQELEERIIKYRGRNGIENNPQIGCIILTEPFFFDEADWIPIPPDWSPNIVTGKRYFTDNTVGSKLYQDVMERMHSAPSAVIREHGPRYAESLTKHRLGQGAFRIGVADAYHRRCAISGEKTLPVLEAAHIKPYGQDGPHAVNNGLLLRSDLHILFDKGYITVDEDYRIDVSKRLHEDYGNGKIYYQYQGNNMLILPDSITERPSKELLLWHNENVFLG